MDFAAGSELQRLGPACFRSSGLSEVVIPQGVVELENEAFSTCAHLRVVSLGRRLRRIGDFCFYGCAIERLSVPACVAEIGVGAFQRCLRLAEVRYERDSCLRVQGSLSFYGCQLQLVVLPRALEGLVLDRGVCCEARVVEYIE